MTAREIEDSIFRKTGGALMAAGLFVAGVVVGLWRGESNAKTEPECGARSDALRESDQPRRE